MPSTNVSSGSSARSTVTDREKITPYLPQIFIAYKESGLQKLKPLDVSVFTAIGYQETHFGWAPGYSPKGDPRGTGDGGHGRGLYQIDDRTWKDWIAKNDWGDPLTNMRKACSILRDNMGYLRSLVSMPGVDDLTFTRCVLAAYNAGPSNARKGLIHHGDPDKFTAHSRYSAYVLAKAADLRVQMPELAVCI